MSKQPLQTDCSEVGFNDFEDAFLEYLDWRWDFEPLIHYVMAAIQFCHRADRPYPDFVIGYLDWFSYKVVFDEDIDEKGRDIPRGSLPTLSRNRNKLSTQWSRYEDCHDLLTGWLAGDLKAALKRQADRLYLVGQVEKMRADGETVDETFAQLEDWFDEAAHTLKRQYDKLTKPKHRMGVSIPIALVRRDGVYVIESRTLDY